MFCNCGQLKQSHRMYCVICKTNSGLDTTLKDLCNERLTSADEKEEKRTDAVSQYYGDDSKGATGGYSEDTIDADACLRRLNIDDDDDQEQEEYDFGRDDFDRSNLLTDEEMIEFQKVLDRCGYSELMKLLVEKNNEWRKTNINIAITGPAGSGKSSFINALRGIKDDETGAAETDCVETTSEPTPYNHPHNESLVLWDLPGIGTPNFPPESYIEKARFKEQDFIILVSSLRFTLNDAWLARRITERFSDANLIFVRTKIDGDLRNKSRGRKFPMTYDKRRNTCIKIKQNCYKNLTQTNIRNPHIFIVNNHEPDTFEFGKLVNLLLHKVSVLKRDALVLSITSFTKEVVTAKINTCMKRVGPVSKMAAYAAVHSNREVGERFQVDILKIELLLYKQQLGIDTKSLEIIAQRFKIDHEQVYDALNSETHAIVKDFEQYYEKHDKVLPSKWYDLPFFGRRAKLKAYQKQSISVLESLLNKCVNKTAHFRETLQYGLKYHQIKMSLPMIYSMQTFA